MSEFNKIIGYEDVIIELTRFCDVLREPKKYEKLGVTMPSGILLYGDPGLGKTLIANCFISESKCKVFTLRKEKPNGDFVNEIKATFEKARNEGPAIVFLDDMDKYANEDNMHRDAEEYVTVQSCIDDCKGAHVFTLATVNDKYCLPDSLLRAGRFDKVIELRAPKGKEAEGIIAHYLEKKKTMGNIDVEEIARLMEGHSCAELETVINEAGIYAGFDGKDIIDQKDIIKACMRMIYESPECSESYDIETKRKIAIHEAGHAVVAEVLEPGCVSLISVCRHSGSIEGITKYKQAETYNLSKKLQENDVMRGVGGKAAIEVVFGVAEVGCNADLRKAFNTVAYLVDDDCTLGFETYEFGNSSGYLLDRKERLVASEMARYYQTAKQIIIENRELLDAITDALLDHKTVTYREIQRIKNDLVISA